jgi:hypothetical protein
MRIGALAWLGLAALAAVALTLAGRERAWAEGAIAVGTTGDVVRYGIAFGVAVDVAKDVAADIAVKRCRTFEARKAAERCQVVATFSGECFAIAYDPTPGTPGAGWGVGPDQLVANQKAVAMCEQSAGPARKGYCQVERHGCDTTGPNPAPKPPEGQTDATPDAKSEGASDAKPETKPLPPADGKAAPIAKEAKGDVEDAKAAKASKEVKDVGQPKEAVGATVTKDDIPKADKRSEADTSPEDAPAAHEPKVKPKTKAAADRVEPKGRSAGSPLFPVLAMAGVGLAYAAGQRLRGRAKGGLAERQIVTGGALAVAAAIAIKLLDMVGAGATMTAAVAGLIALGAALLA